MDTTRRGFVALLAILPVAACSGQFETAFDAPLPAEQSAAWRLAGVQVDVPESLTVSEARTYLPDADIVWREDPEGDRHPQVARIMEDAIRRGGAGLRGGRPVILQAEVTRFHALTFEAETRLQNSGVHNIQFVLQVVDARSGEVLAGPSLILAELPALAGSEMAAAREQGHSQKSMITAHVAQTVAAWLGIGPDNRGSFNRRGN